MVEHASPNTRPQDLPAATFWWRLLVVATALLWTSGLVEQQRRDGRIVAADSDASLLLSALLSVLMLAFVVAIVVFTFQCTRALSMESPGKWAAGAWVPCCNPIVVLIVTARLLEAYREHGLSRLLVFASRERVLAEIRRQAHVRR